MKDYYEILEVNKNASDDIIKKVFRMLIKKNHPDLFEGEAKIKAEEKVKELNEAYEILINKESREKYNLQLEEAKKTDDEVLTVLMEENEYLKSVIQEKNKLINEFLKDKGMDTNEFDDSMNFSDYSEENNEYTTDTDNTTVTEGYNLYVRKQQIKKILYTLSMAFFVILVLCVITNINIFKIFINTIKAMF